NAYQGHGGGYELGEALLQRAADVVHVVHGAAENFAVGAGIEELERQPLELLLDLTTNGVDRCLRHSGHEVLLNVLEGRAEQIQPQQEQQNLPDVVEIDISGPLALEHHALEELGGRQSEDFWPDHIERGTDDGRDEDEHEWNALWVKVTEQPQQRSAKVFGFLNWHPPAPHPRATPKGHGRRGAAATHAHAISSRESC